MKKCISCGLTLESVRPGVDQCKNQYCKLYGRGVYQDQKEAAAFKEKLEKALTYHNG